MAENIDGKHHAHLVREQQKQRIAQHIHLHGRAPGLGVVLVEGDAASAVYVRHKAKAASACGMHVRIDRLSPDTTQTQLEEAIQSMNQDSSIDAFLVQLPLPEHIDTQSALLKISPSKDADGLHPYNIGRLSLGLPCPRPCTPAGVIHLLRAYQISMAGKHAVVIGRSDIVGKPMLQLLLQENATVTCCHSKTQDLAIHLRQADIIISAVGQEKTVQPQHIRPSTVLVDVGIIRRADGSLCGDIAPECAHHASYLTPVPGGVGPMTVAMLLSNVVQSWLSAKNNA